MRLKDGVRHDFDEWPNLIMHNINTLEMLLELTLGRVELRLAHLPLSTLWGTVFVFYLWSVAPDLARHARCTTSSPPGISHGNGGNFPCAQAPGSAGGLPAAHPLRRIPCLAFQQTFSSTGRCPCASRRRVFSASSLFL